MGIFRREIHVSKAMDLIKAGGIVTVEFEKQNRKMRVLTGVYNPLGGTAVQPQLPYINMYDTDSAVFRHVNLASLHTVTVDRKTYYVVR